jgi:hypothetical protein
MEQRKIQLAYGVIGSSIQAVAARLPDDTWLLEFSDHKDAAKTINEVRQKFEAAALEFRVTPPKSHPMPQAERRPHWLLNRAQRVVLIIGAAVIIAMMLFPPFHTEVVDRGQTVVMNLGYSAIWSPPAFALRPQVLGEINVPLLSIQITAVVVVTALILCALLSSSRNATD